MAAKEMYGQQEAAETLFEQASVETQRASGIKKRRLRFVVLTLVVMGVIGYLMYAGIRDTVGYYMTVSELIGQGPQLSQDKVRVSGKVSEGSVNWDPGERILHFAIADEQNTTLAVVYQGVVPDSFKQGQKVILEGVYADGVFTASQLLTSCASKYE